MQRQLDAIKYCEKSLEYFDGSRDVAQFRKVEVLLGDLYTKFGSAYEAISLYERGLERAEELGDVLSQSFYCNQLTRVNISLEIMDYAKREIHSLLCLLHHTGLIHQQRIDSIEVSPAILTYQGRRLRIDLLKLVHALLLIARIQITDHKTHHRIHRILSRSQHIHFGSALPAQDSEVSIDAVLPLLVCSELIGLCTEKGIPLDELAGIR